LKSDNTLFFRFLINIISIFVVHIVLVEDYVGIISDDEKKEDPFLVIPKFDRVPVLLLFYMWWMLCGVASTEGLAAPITIAMYNWTNEEAVLYNGIIQVNLMWSVDIRLHDYRFDTNWNMACFIGFDLNPILNGTASVSGGGCPVEYEWCDYTPRVPMVLYLFNFAIIQGFSFPLISAPSNTLLSEIVGPRKQGAIQGLFAFTGSMAQFTVPIFSTALFETSGYKYIMVYHLVAITLAGLMVFILRGRLVPLEMTPSAGKATKYKRGTFYRM
ncbi:hypothetical protein COOONC_03338, partial [Cooperia oncophora]